MSTPASRANLRVAGVARTRRGRPSSTWGLAAGGAATATCAGAAGAGLSVVVSGHDSLGASGAILGMLGAAVVFGVRYRGEIPKALRDFFGIDLWFFVLMVAVLSLFPFVDWAGHLGGFLWGVFVGLTWPARMVTGPPTVLGRTVQSSAG